MSHRLKVVSADIHAKPIELSKSKFDCLIFIAVINQLFSNYMPNEDEMRREEEA
jgi:hypothetical protein